MKQNAILRVVHSHGGGCLMEGFCLAGPENERRGLRRPQACGLNVSACRGFAKSVVKKSN